MTTCRLLCAARKVRFSASRFAHRMSLMGRAPLPGRHRRQTGMLHIAAGRGWRARSISLVTCAEDAVRPVPALQQRLVWGGTVVRSRPPHMRLLTESRRRIVARNVRPTGFDDGRASAQNPESTSHHASSWRTA